MSERSARASRLCQSASKSVVFCIALSFLRADTSRRRTNTHHPHIYVTCVIRCRVSHTYAHQLLKSRPHTPLRCASRTPARAPQRARRAPCWRRWAAPTTASARAAGRRGRLDTPAQHRAARATRPLTAAAAARRRLRRAAGAARTCRGCILRARGSSAEPTSLTGALGWR